MRFKTPRERRYKIFLAPPRVLTYQFHGAKPPVMTTELINAKKRYERILFSHSLNYFMNRSTERWETSVNEARAKLWDIINRQGGEKFDWKHRRAYMERVEEPQKWRAYDAAARYTRIADRKKLGKKKLPKYVKKPKIYKRRQNLTQPQHPRHITIDYSDHPLVRAWEARGLTPDY